jgi:hypothetical protein
MTFKPTVVEVLTVDPEQPDSSVYLEEAEEVDGVTFSKRLTKPAAMALEALDSSSTIGTRSTSRSGGRSFTRDRQPTTRARSRSHLFEPEANWFRHSK